MGVHSIMFNDAATDEVRIVFTLPGKEQGSIGVMDITGLSVHAGELGVHGRAEAWWYKGCAAVGEGVEGQYLFAKWFTFL